MEQKLYDRYNDFYPERVIANGLQEVESLMQSIVNHSYSVPRTYEKFYQTQEVLDAEYY
ncbi:hypothetical protein L0665_01220 [Methanogenium marinum]|uniref:Uncharacterized protein n=1 Tax=Methanogenium marinum TaxID=348610 RepID=A0A9Q4KRB5_9EURY|nr:hypothetical protein [Methanogenium marinum]MDE4907247.1 hypothetical protein [Methanogenium marinum]